MRSINQSNYLDFATHLDWVHPQHDDFLSHGSLSIRGISVMWTSKLPTTEGEDFHHCCRVWRMTWAALLRTKEQNKRLTDCQTEALTKTKDLVCTKHVPLQTESQKFPQTSLVYLRLRLWLIQFMFSWYCLRTWRCKMCSCFLLKACFV